MYTVSAVPAVPAKGVAISLVAPAEGHRAQAIEDLQNKPLRWEQLDNLKSKGGEPLLPAMTTLCIGAGRRTSCARATSSAR